MGHGPILLMFIAGEINTKHVIIQVLNYTDCKEGRQDAQSVSHRADTCAGVGRLPNSLEMRGELACARETACKNAWHSEILFISRVSIKKEWGCPWETEMTQGPAANRGIRNAVKNKVVLQSGWSLGDGHPVVDRSPP